MIYGPKEDELSDGILDSSGINQQISQAKSNQKRLIQRLKILNAHPQKVIKAEHAKQEKFITVQNDRQESDEYDQERLETYRRMVQHSRNQALKYMKAQKELKLRKLQQLKKEKERLEQERLEAQKNQELQMQIRQKLRLESIEHRLNQRIISIDTRGKQLKDANTRLEEIKSKTYLYSEIEQRFKNKGAEEEKLRQIKLQQHKNHYKPVRLPDIREHQEKIRVCQQQLQKFREIDLETNPYFVLQQQQSNRMHKSSSVNAKQFAEPLGNLEDAKICQNYLGLTEIGTISTEQQ